MLPDLPETLIKGREREYLDWFLRRKAANPDTFTDSDLDEYVRILAKDGGLRAGLAYYRAAHESAKQNEAMKRRGMLQMPLLALGSDQGSIPDMATPLRDFFANVVGRNIRYCGHFLPEEQPRAVADELGAFFGAADQ